ncbi:MAG: YoaK family protein [Asticcacaulis sp.]
MKTQTRLLLTFLAGYCDTVTFVHMKGVFSAHVTGNFVLFAAALTQGLTARDYLKLLTFPVFVVAVAMATFIYARTETARLKGGKTTGLSRILSLMAGLLGLGSALSFLGSEQVDIAITLMVVLAMGMQNALHPFIPGAMTTVMTGTVTNTVSSLTHRVMKLNRTTTTTASVNTLWLILLFGGGCALAAFAAKSLHYSSLIPAALICLYVWRGEGFTSPKETRHA